jgi:uncharacterized protein YbaP (TraB family)
VTGRVAAIVAGALFAFLSAARFCDAAPSISAVPETAAPPFWIVERDGKRLYLFGSIHMLPPQTKWKREEIERALDASQVFVFEAPLSDDDREISRFVEAQGTLRDGLLLRDALPPERYAELETTAAGVQCAPDMFRTLRPWMAAITLERCSFTHTGFSRYYGADQTIAREAKAHGATLAYLETMDEQLSAFSGLAPEEEIAYLTRTLRGVKADPDLPHELLSAWSSGNVEVLAQLIDSGFDGAPALKSRLLIERNRRWIARIKEMLASDGTHFVTVGVGHLVGEGSVVALLRAEGFSVTGP